MHWLVVAGARNTLGAELLYISKHHRGHDFLRGLYEGSDPSLKLSFDVDHSQFHGIAGKLLLTEHCIQEGG